MSPFIRNAMGAACGVMGWSPQTFWQSTPLDLLNAWHGFEQFHGLKSSRDLTQEDVQQLRILLNEQPHVI